MRRLFSRYVHKPDVHIFIRHPGIGQFERNKACWQLPQRAATGEKSLTGPQLCGPNRLLSRAVLSLWSQRSSYSQQNQTQVDLSPKYSASHHGFKLQSVFPERNLLPSHSRSACPWNSSCAIPASFWIFPQTVPPPKSVSKSLRQKGCSSQS